MRAELISDERLSDEWSPITDIKDPKIDEKPPPYECTSCGYSTWSWNEAKHHICGLTEKKQGKKKVQPEIQLPSRNQPGTVQATGQAVEDVVRLTLEARADHPDWSADRIIQSVMKSYAATKTHS